MKAAEAAERAAEALAAGREKRALRLAWSAATGAIRQRDDPPVAMALRVADQLSHSGSPKVAKEAQRLAAYCRAVIDGVGGGVNAPTVVDRLIRRNGPPDPARMRCPRCAEDIAAAAKVCRYCGHQLSA